MPGRLIIFILILAIILFFIGLNLDNKCDINFGITKLENTPVFFPIFVSFALGLICSLPFIIKSKIGRKRNETTKDKKPDKDDFPVPDEVPYIDEIGADEKIKQDAAEAKKRFFSKRRENK
jgi:hypothetical protein